MNKHTNWYRSALLWLSTITALLAASSSFAQSLTSLHEQLLNCSWNWGIFCAEQGEIPNSWYVGHDEPSLLFYSDSHGNNVWKLRLPKDPAQPPQQDGNGTTWNFQ